MLKERIPRVGRMAEMDKRMSKRPSQSYLGETLRLETT